MYRRTSKSCLRRKWRPREEVAAELQRPALWQPPELRRRVTIEDFDGPETQLHVIELHRTSRIDCYRAVVDGHAWRDSIGWSRVLDGLRKALPRVASPRRLAEQ